MQMINQKHPIQSTPNLRQLWINQAQRLHPGNHWIEWLEYVATKAVQWAADTQLEKALEYLDRNNQWAKVDLDEMRNALRPKPISKQQQALLAIDAAIADDRLSADVANVVRAAFEELGI
jgi:hypothetical protein